MTAVDQVNAMIHAIASGLAAVSSCREKVVASLLILIDELKCWTDSHIA